MDQSFKPIYYIGEEVGLANNHSVRVLIKEILGSQERPKYFCKCQLENGLIINTTFRNEELRRFK
ncbi:hypothetical protein [Marinoscillum pacificum]|uniref:hypothetical protein n=1 Tax=Marinoscillum pacificum TaxID=392723 RepID=UPI00215890B4|nr:hypothetical protein [Marinoscillum pacificum]